MDRDTGDPRNRAEMTISLDGLLRLAGGDAARFRRLGLLARRLGALDAKRAALVAELAELGVVEVAASAPPARANQRRRAPDEPLCAVCGAPGEMEVDGRWLCEPHGDAAVAPQP